MVKKSLLFIVIFLMFACKQNRSTTNFKNYHSEIKNYQYRLNLEFSNKSTSPLTKEGFKKFTSLDFFPIDSSYKVKAKFIRTPNEKPFEMPTTKSRKAIEVKYGELHFTLHGLPLKLNVYQSQELKLKPEYKDYLFLPFTDLSNGKETYHGGRYIDLKLPVGDTLIIDFNKAYNPYCAYSDRYSCPIPPKENNLTIKILAGVKAYKK